MNIFLLVNRFVIRTMVPQIATHLGGLEAAKALDAVLTKVVQHFRDPSQRLPKALKSSQEQAWRALEIALAGESLWSWLDSKETKVLRGVLEDFFRQVQFSQSDDLPPDFRRRCVEEIRQARRAGLFEPPQNIDQHEELSKGLARLADAQAILASDHQELCSLGQVFEKLGYVSLGKLFQLPAGNCGNILLVAQRYFFRQATLRDRDLFAELSLTHLETLTDEQRQGFAALAQQQTASLEVLLAQFGSMHERFAELSEQIKALSANNGLPAQGNQPQTKSEPNQPKTEAQLPAKYEAKQPPERVQHEKRRQKEHLPVEKPEAKKVTAVLLGVVFSLVGLGLFSWVGLMFIFWLGGMFNTTPTGLANPAPRQPGEEREFEISKGVRMKFCWIPAGKATLGTPGNATDEKEHEYETKGFWLGKYEVTQAQWEAVMGADPSMFKGAKLPVENVSWEDCQRFLNECTLKNLSLPHEDQWEYAARGGLGNKRAYYWGDTLNAEANCNNTQSTEVGSFERKAKHPWGLCDMAGNVREWCANVDSKEPTQRVLRGGSWYGNPVECRSASRYGFAPDIRSDVYGFRVCLSSE